MAMNIKNKEVHELAALLAREEGKSITQVVLEALRDRRQNGQEARRRREVERALEELRGCLKDTPGNGVIMSVEDLYDPETGLPK